MYRPRAASHAYAPRPWLRLERPIAAAGARTPAGAAPLVDERKAADTHGSASREYTIADGSVRERARGDASLLVMAVGEKVGKLPRNRRSDRRK